MLADLPQWIDWLAEAAVGDVRMSDGGGGAYGSRYPINGEHNVAHYLATFPGDADDPPDDKALHRRYAIARRTALAAGGVNERASTLMDRVTNTLTTIVRDLCESRGTALPPSAISDIRIRLGGYAAARLAARWLSGQLTAISADETAGHIYSEIHCLVGDERRDGRIGKAINRPIPMRDLGRCPTWNEDTRTICGTALRARADVIEVYCRNCRTTHNTDRLQLLMVNDLARAKVTSAEILLLNRMLPEDYRIVESTLRRWQSPVKGAPPRLKTRGFLRPCPCGHGSRHHDRHRDAGCRKCADCTTYGGREVINRHGEDDEILYLWADVRQLRAEQWKVNAS